LLDFQLEDTDFELLHMERAYSDTAEATQLNLKQCSQFFVIRNIESVPSLQCFWVAIAFRREQAIIPLKSSQQLLFKMASPARDDD
jgi:hypothetical protein